MQKNTHKIKLAKTRSINQTPPLASPVSPSNPRSQRAQKTASWTKGQSAQQLVKRQKALPESSGVQGGTAIGKSFGQRRTARQVVPQVVDRQGEIDAWMSEHERRLRMNALNVQGHDPIDLDKVQIGFAKLAGTSASPIHDPRMNIAESEAIARGQAAMDAAHTCDVTLHKTLTSRPGDAQLEKQLQILNKALAAKVPGSPPTIGNIVNTVAGWFKNLYQHCWSRKMQEDFSAFDLNESIDSLKTMLAEARHTIASLHALSKNLEDPAGLGLTGEVAELALQLRDALKDMSAVLADHVDGPARQLQRFGFRELSEQVALRRNNTVQDQAAEPTVPVAKPLPARHPAVAAADTTAHRALDQVRAEFRSLQTLADQKSDAAQTDLNELKLLQADPEMQSIEKDAAYRDSLYVTRHAMALLQRKRLHDTAAAQRQDLARRQGDTPMHLWGAGALAELRRLETFSWSFSQRELNGLAELEERLQNGVYQQAVERDARLLKKYEHLQFLKQAHAQSLQPDQRIERTQHNLEERMRKAYRSMGLEALKWELASYEQRSGLEQQLIQAAVVNAYATHDPIELEQEIVEAERSYKQAIGAQAGTLLHELELMQHALAIARSRAAPRLQTEPSDDTRQPDPIALPPSGEMTDPAQVFASAVTAAERLLAPARKDDGPSELKNTSDKV